MRPHQNQKLLFFQGYNQESKKGNVYNGWKKLAHHVSDNYVVSSIYKELLHIATYTTKNCHILLHILISNKRKISPILKQAKDLNGHFSKEDIQMAVKICTKLLVIREIQTKITVRNTPTRMMPTINADWNMEKLDPNLSTVLVGM